MGYKDPTQRKKYQREYVSNNRKKYFAGKKCARCPATDELQIHHRDPSQKIAHRIWSWAEARRFRELAKCEVLCKTCHDKHHAAERRAPCGTPSAYHRGCRCDACRKAHSDAWKEYQERTGYRK